MNTIGRRTICFVTVPLLISPACPQTVQVRFRVGHRFSVGAFS